MRRSLRRSMSAFVAVVLVAMASCGNDDERRTTGTDIRPDTSSSFGWAPLDTGEDVLGAIEDGALEVPVDYDDPSAGTFDVYVVRHLATDPDHRIGSLLVNPGGPGAAGSELAILAALNYGDDVLRRFDIVGWDPRGTGSSTPAIDCIDDYDRFFTEVDITPDDDVERQHAIDLAQEFQTDCATRNADIIDHVGTNESARDIDAIRAALGEPKVSYFGFSYGSELGATWATLFPDTVRAAVFDGAIDPNADLATSTVDQSAGFEHTLSTFLAQCSGDDECAFHNGGDAEGAFEDLMTSLDEHPIPTVAGRPDANLQVLVGGTTQAMYAQRLWPDLAQALADAQAGKGAGLLALFDQYFERRDDGTWANTLEAFQTIFCMDRGDRPTIAEEDAVAAQQRAASPHLAPGTIGGYQCTFYPPTTDPRGPITGAGAGPLLVVGTTGDPATPLASSQAMADALEGGVLLTVVADEHTGYHANACSTQTIDAYLTDLTVPAAGTRCE